MTSKTSRSRDLYATKLKRRLSKARGHSERKALTDSLELLELEAGSKEVWSEPLVNLLLSFCRYSISFFGRGHNPIRASQDYPARVLDLFRTLMKRKMVIFPADWIGLPDLQATFLGCMFQQIGNQRPNFSDAALSHAFFAADIDKIIATEQALIEEAINFWRVGGNTDRLLSQILEGFHWLEFREYPGVYARSDASQLPPDEIEDFDEYIKALIEVEHSRLGIIYLRYFQALGNLGDLYLNRTNDVLWTETTSMVEMLERLNDKRAKNSMTVENLALIDRAKLTLERWSENAR